MEIVRQTLIKSLHPSRPYLFYGPSSSGKKTAIANVLRSMKIRPVVYSMDEAQHAALNPIDLSGRLGYIVYLDSLEVLKKDPKLLVLYVTLDPYSLGTSEQLNAKFTLVDLSRALRASPAVDNELIKVPPWELFKKLAISGRASSYDSKLVLVERSPMFVQSLHNNVFGVTVDPKTKQDRITIPRLQVEGIASTLDRLSELDRSFYVDHSGDHANLLENMAMLRGLGLNGGEMLDWTKKAGHNRFNGVKVKDRKKIDAALYRYSALAGPAKAAGSIPKTTKRPPANPDAPPKPRQAPKCKQCGVPLKGHRCPNKKPKEINIKP